MQKVVPIEGVLTGLRMVLAQNLVALDWPRTEVARILGISPAAVTLYSRGKRGKEYAEIIRNTPEAQAIAQEVAASIIDAIRNDTALDVFPLILDAAYKIIQVISREGSGLSSNKQPQTAKRTQRRKIKLKRLNDRLKSLENRLEEEQRAARRSMVLAASSQDDVARAVFRQIATDSIRHADLVSIVIGAIGKDESITARSSGGGHSRVNIKHDIEAMLAEEERAGGEAIKIPGIRPDLLVLLKSIELDERKHRVMLKELLKSLSRQEKIIGAKRP